MVNWTKIVSALGKDTLRDFSNGEISGRTLYDLALDVRSFTPQTDNVSGEVRNLLRERGVDEARQLARKALSRR